MRERNTRENIIDRRNQMLDTDELKFDGAGLIPAVVVDYISKKVLMVAYMAVSFDRAAEFQLFGFIHAAADIGFRVSESIRIRKGVAQVFGDLLIVRIEGHVRRVLNLPSSELKIHSFTSRSKSDYKNYHEIDDHY